MAHTQFLTPPPPREPQHLPNRPDGALRGLLARRPVR